MKNPCDQNCPRRGIGCHSKCEDYLAWVEELRALKNAEAEAKKVEGDFAGYASRAYQRMQKRRKKK